MTLAAGIRGFDPSRRLTTTVNKSPRGSENNLLKTPRQPSRRLSQNALEMKEKHLDDENSESEDGSEGYDFFAGETEANI